MDLKNRVVATPNTSGLNAADIKSIQNIFKNNSKIHAVLLYGSRAKGNFKSGSDIDLTLIGNEISLDDLLSLRSEFEELLIPYKLDLSIYSQIDNKALCDHINRVGQIFYIF